MVNLIPFNPSYAGQIQKWNLDESCRRFWRGFKRHLTFDECANLPGVMNQEVLMIVDENDVGIGLITINEEQFGTCKFGIMVGYENRGNGIGSESLDKLEKYIFELKAARLIITECFFSDNETRDSIVHKGYIECGEIPDYGMDLGKYEPIVIYCKKASDWRQKWAES